MAVCRMDAALWKISSAVKQAPGALESAKGPCSGKLPRNGPQRVRASAQTLKRVCNLRVWNVGYRIPSQLQMRCNATPEGSDGDSKSYDINEVVEKVVESEEGKIPESDKEASPDELPEGEPSPFSPAIDVETDDTSHAKQGAGVTKESLVEPSRNSLDQVSGAASSSLGEIDGSEEHLFESAKAPIIEMQQTAVHSGQGGLQGGSSSTGRDWRVYSSGNDDGQIGSFGWSEEGSFVALAGILQEDGGKSIADYRSRADIFGKSAEFFAARKRAVSV